MKRGILSAGWAAILIGCFDTRNEPARSPDAVYLNPDVDTVFRALYTREVGYRVIDGSTEKKVRRLETGDLHSPPYPDWEKPTFDDAELVKIAGHLERLRPANLPLIERAFFVRDLWMAFDEMSGKGEAYERVQRLLARAIRDLAPSTAELEGMPAPPWPAAMPRDLGDPAAGWVELSADNEDHVEGLRASSHAVSTRGHSWFRFFMKFDRGGAREHAEKLFKGEEIELPGGITVALLEYASFISRELSVVPSPVILTFQSRRIDRPATDIGDVAEFRYRRRRIFAGWKDGGLERTDPESEGNGTLSISNAAVGGDTLDQPLKAQCAQCHNPQSWTTDAEINSKRFGSIRSLIPKGGDGLGRRDRQIQTSRAVLESYGNLKRLQKYARP